MDYCSLLLNRKRGFTLIEVLITMTTIVAIATVILIAVSPSFQLGKGRDGRRKADLNLLKTAMDDYYNDNECYPDISKLVCKPGTGLIPYMKKVPCDPLTGENYRYENPLSNCDSYVIYANLENNKDVDIYKTGCLTGCQGSNGIVYNYAITSSNIRVNALPTVVAGDKGGRDGDGGGVGGVVECPGQTYACQRAQGQSESDGRCNAINKNDPYAQEWLPFYCESDCQGHCPT